MSTDSKSYQEFLKENEIPVDSFANKTYGNFSPDEVESYLLIHGQEALVSRMRIDKKWETSAALDREIEEKQKQVGRGKPSRSDWESLQSELTGAGEHRKEEIRQEINDMVARAEKYGGFSED